MRSDAHPGRRLFTVCIISVFAAALAAAAVIGALRRERERLRAELAPFIVPPVTVNGTVYRFERGRIEPEARLSTEIRALRLTRYAVLARIDPIFALSGVDVARLETAVQALGTSSAALADGGVWGPYRKSIGALYPLEFLQSLPALEALRRDVAMGADVDAARRYQALLEKTALAAIRAAARYREALTDADRTVTALRNGRPFGDMYFLKTLTDAATIDRAVLAVADGMRGQLAAIRARGGCLSFMRRCGGQLVFGWQKAITPEPVRLPLGPVRPEVVEILGATARMGRGIAGDVTFWLQTPCFGSEERLRPFAILRRTSQSIQALYYPDWKHVGLGDVADPHALDAMFFSRIAQGPIWIQSFFERLTSIGVPVFWQPHAIYTCPDVRYYAYLLSFAAAADTLRHQPVFSDSARLQPESGVGDAIGEIAGLEERIASSASLSVYDFNGYVRGLGALFSAVDEFKLAQRLGKERVLAAEELAMRLSQGGGAFDRLIAAGVFRNYQLMRFRAYAEPDDFENAVSLRYQLVATGVPSIYFLAFNPTFIGGAQPEFIADRPMAADSPFIELAELLKSRTKKEVKEIIEFGAASFPLFPLQEPLNAAPPQERE